MILAVWVSLEVLGQVVESSGGNRGGDNPKVEKQIQLNSFCAQSDDWMIQKSSEQIRSNKRKRIPD